MALHDHKNQQHSTPMLMLIPHAHMTCKSNPCYLSLYTLWNICIHIHIYIVGISNTYWLSETGDNSTVNIVSVV